MSRLLALLERCTFESGPKVVDIRCFTYQQVSDERRRVQLECRVCFRPSKEWCHSLARCSDCRPAATGVIKLLIIKKNKINVVYHAVLFLKVGVLSDSKFIFNKMKEITVVEYLIIYRSSDWTPNLESTNLDSFSVWFCLL